MVVMACLITLRGCGASERKFYRWLVLFVVRATVPVTEACWPKAGPDVHRQHVPTQQVSDGTAVKLGESLVLALYKQRPEAVLVGQPTMP